jgi:2'-hydroxyisoflavone reductase
VLAAVNARRVGTFNLVGTPGALTLGDVLDACIDVTGSDTTLRWATTEFLLAHDVGQWVEMPLWLADAPEFAGLLAVSNERARATGLQLRPLRETVRDTLVEYRTRPPEYAMKAGLRPERERALLDALHVDTPSIR